MLRRIALALVALVFTFASVMAADYTGKVKTIDAKKGSVTITYKDGDKEVSKDFDIPPLASVVGPDGKELKGKKRLATISKDTSITLTTEKKKVGDEEKEVITKVKVNKASE
ncbi:MAG: hypothetical protein K2R98_34140 [Gemmataceae bacterium]|nr:hypothetical protein [Gemmataceae bacterium]